MTKLKTFKEVYDDHNDWARWYYESFMDLALTGYTETEIKYIERSCSPGWIPNEWMKPNEPNNLLLLLI